MLFTQGHALLIGVGSHQFHPNMDVPITLSDANAVAEALRDPDACGYPAGQVQVLHDSSASKAGILSALDELADRTGADDTIFLFYCGHGALGTDGNYYLVSHDARIKGTKVAAGTGVSEGELLKALQNLKPSRLFMVFNACHSGNLSPALEVEQETLQTSNPGGDATVALLGTGQGRIIIVACREQQVSYIGNGPTTIFTTALLEGLRGIGVRNNNGFVSAFSLYEHVYESVSATVKAQIGAVQEPELTVLKGVGPFAVSLYKGGGVLGVFDADERTPRGMPVREATAEDSARLFVQHATHVGGNVQTGGGDFVGRDKEVHGDEVRGHSIKGTVSNVGAGAQVAIGKGITQTITRALPDLTDEDLRQVRQLLSQVKEQIAAVDIPESKKLMGGEFAGQLEQELIRRDGPPDGSVIKVAGDWLIKNIPAIGGTLASLFLNPVVGKIVEAAGDIAASWVKRQFGEPAGR